MPVTLKPPPGRAMLMLDHLTAGLDAARHFVMDDINDVLQRWQATRLLDGTETEAALPDPVED